MSQTDDIKQPLFNPKEGQHFSFGVEELCELFHPDNINNKVPGSNITESIHKYWTVMGGSHGIARGLRTNLKIGIEADEKDIQQREEAFGKNFKRPPKIKTLCEIIMQNFEDRILQILLIAAAVSLMIGIIENGWKVGWIDGLSIFIAVFIIVTVTSGNNYMKELQFQNLVKQFSEATIPVYRGGTGLTQTISDQRLLVGDIIKLETGMKIPADCILIEGTDIATDESAMTGEPEQVEKASVNQDNYIYNPNPFLLAKTLLVTGQGMALVCAVGRHTRSGIAEEKLNIEDEPTPLQGKLETIANEIGKVGLIVSVMTFIAMTINLIIKTTLDPKKKLWDLSTLGQLVNFIIISITVIVVAVPEGLPLAVTIALSYSGKKMQKENNLVKKLDASETMGGANEICTDKTGTLTKNQMTVQRLFTLETVYDTVDIKTLDEEFNQVSQFMIEGVLFNCSARIEQNAQGLREVKGNSTEQGLIKFLTSKQVDTFSIIRKKEDNILQIIPFNSKRKRACCVIKHPDENVVRVFLKGAPEIVLDHCTNYFNSNGQVQELSKNKKDLIVNETIKSEFAKDALRTLLICYKDITFDQYHALAAQHNNFAKEEDREILETEMTMICIYGLEDPLRDEIVESVNKCRTAGIRIRMVTGDNIDTARAIALKAGILTEQEANEQYSCMEGKTFREICGGLKALKDETGRGLTKEEIGNKSTFRAVEKKLRVLARSTPEDKYMLVTGLKELDHVVAVTGDGTNDAPALRKADVGFAMGITGTDVAKDACDIVLLDDNFASIVTAVKWGRNIYANVRKFLQFQLTVNVVAMFIVFLGGAVITDPPLTSVQMLWVNLIMDTFAALALATEPPHDGLLLDKPYNRSEKIVTATMWRNIVGQALYQIIVLVTMLFGGEQLFGFSYDKSITGRPSFYYDDSTFPVFPVRLPDGLPYVEGSGDIMAQLGDPTPKCYHYTMIFNTFVFMQVFNEINSRKLGAYEYNVFKGFFNNWLFILILIVTIGVQYVMVQYGGLPIRAAPLTYEEHLICLGLGLISLIVGVIIKLVMPVRWFDKVEMKEEIMDDEQEKSALVSKLRTSFRQSLTKRIKDDKLNQSSAKVQCD